MSAGTRLKLVFYKGRVRVFLGKREIPISRLPDLVPIYLDKVNPDAGGAVVLEGYAWYGEGEEDWFDNYLLPPLENENDEESKNSTSIGYYAKNEVLREVRSSDGRFILKLVGSEGGGGRLEVYLNYRGRWYRAVFVSSLNKMRHVLSPELILIRMGFSVSNSDIRRAITSYLMERDIREFVRWVSSFSQETNNKKKGE